MFPLTAVIGLVAGAGVVSGQRYHHVSTTHQGNYMEKFELEGINNKKYLSVDWNNPHFKKDNFFGIDFESFRDWTAQFAVQTQPATLDIVSRKSYKRGLFMVTINHSNTKQCAVQQSVYLFNNNTRIYAPLRGSKFSQHRLQGEIGESLETCTMLEQAGSFRRCDARHCSSSSKDNVHVQGPTVYTFLVDKTGVRTWVWPKAEEPQNFAKEWVNVTKFGPPTMHILREEEASNRKCNPVARLDNVWLAIGANLCHQPLANECGNYNKSDVCRSAILVAPGTSRDLVRGIKFDVERVDIWEVDENAKACKPTDPKKNKPTDPKKDKPTDPTKDKPTDPTKDEDKNKNKNKDHKRPECKPKKVKPTTDDKTGVETDDKTGGKTGGKTDDKTGGKTGGKTDDKTGGKTDDKTGGKTGGKTDDKTDDKTDNKTGTEIDVPAKHNGTFVTRTITRIQTSKCPSTPTGSVKATSTCTDKVTTVYETEISPVITPRVSTFVKTITVPCKDPAATSTCTTTEKWVATEGGNSAPATVTATVINVYCVCPPQDPNCANKGKVIPTTVPVVTKTADKDPAATATDKDVATDKATVNSPAVFYVTKTLCSTSTYVVNCTATAKAADNKVPVCTPGVNATTTVPTAIEVSPVTTPTTVTETVTCTQKPTCTNVVRVICLACVGGAAPAQNGTSAAQLPAADKKPLVPVEDKSVKGGSTKVQEPKPEESGAVKGNAVNEEKPKTGGDEKPTAGGDVLGNAVNEEQPKKATLTQEPSEGKGGEGVDSVKDKSVAGPKDKSDQAVAGNAFSDKEEEIPASKPAEKGDLPAQGSSVNGVPVDEEPAKVSPPAPADSGVAGQAGSDSIVPLVDGSAAAKPVLSLIAVFAAMLLW